MSTPQFGPCPPRFVDLKKEIAASYPDFEANATKAWGEILAEAEKVTKEIASEGSKVSADSPVMRQHGGYVCVLTMLAGQGVPEVRFDELGSLSEEQVAEIRRKGCLVIRDVVGDEEARTWQAWLREYVAQNPVDGEDMLETLTMGLL